MRLPPQSSVKGTTKVKIKPRVNKITMVASASNIPRATTNG